MVTIPSPSSLSRLLSTQTQLARLQRNVGEAQAELASGRIADPGRTLGARITDVVGLRQDLAQVDATIETNGLVAARLEGSAAALSSISDGASAFLDSLVAARSNVSSAGILTQAARDGLGRIIEALGTRVAGVAVFSGIAGDESPLAQYFSTPAPASQSAVATAFTAHFGMTQADPAVANIDASLMQGYVDTVYAGLFDDASWSSQWSSASNESVSSRVGDDLVIEASVTANEPAIRNVIRALVLVADSATAELNGGAYGVVVDEAIRLVGQAIGGLTELEGRVGTMQSRVSDTTNALELRRNMVSRSIGEMEDVDAAELSTRLSALISQMEAAYTVTARLQRLSLLDEI